MKSKINIIEIDVFKILSMYLYIIGQQRILINNIGKNKKQRYYNPQFFCEDIFYYLTN